MQLTNYFDICSNHSHRCIIGTLCINLVKKLLSASMGVTDTITIVESLCLSYFRYSKEYK